MHGLIYSSVLRAGKVNAPEFASVYQIGVLGVIPVELKRCERVDLPLRGNLLEGMLEGLDFKVNVASGNVPDVDLDRIFGGGWRRPNRDHFLGANALMLPELWSDRMGMPSSLQISVMHDAWVFGGLITQRTETTHAQGQALLTWNGGITEDSFGIMDGNVTWSDEVLAQDEAGGAWDYVGPSAATRLQGDYYFVGNVHRHFGHVMLEGIARLWALAQVAEVSPDAKFLVYESSLQPFALELLVLAGIPENRIVFASAATSVERLFIPSAAMRTHRFISSAMGEVWGRMAKGSIVGRPRPAFRKIYLSRRGVESRPLHNEVLLEELLRSFDFEIVSPEEMTIREQVRMATEAAVLAGPVGSQMYLAAFQPAGSRVIVVAPRNFYLKDDTLLAAVKSHELAVCFGSPIDFREGNAGRRWEVSLDVVRDRIQEFGATTAAQ